MRVQRFACKHCEHTLSRNRLHEGMTQVRESGQGRDTSASVRVGRGLTVPSLAAGWRLSPSGMALVSRACLGQLLCVKFESRCALRSRRLRHVLPKGAAGATLAAVSSLAARHAYCRCPLRVCSATSALYYSSHWGLARWGRAPLQGALTARTPAMCPKPLFSRPLLSIGCASASSGFVLARAQSGSSSRSCDHVPLSSLFLPAITGSKTCAPP